MQPRKEITSRALARAKNLVWPAQMDFNSA
jgi:hypothetical protein